MNEKIIFSKKILSFLAARNFTIETREVPQQAFRACFGTMQLMKAYGREKLDRACQRALELNVIRYQSVASILKNGLEEKQGGPVSAAEQSLPKHHNIRGKDYYQ